MRTLTTWMMHICCSYELGLTTHPLLPDIVVGYLQLLLARSASILLPLAVTEEQCLYSMSQNNEEY